MSENENNSKEVIDLEAQDSHDSPKNDENEIQKENENDAKPEANNNAGSEEIEASPRRRIVRRYSNADYSTAELVQTAVEIMRQWDVDHKGFITVDDIVLPKVDPKFIAAMARVFAVDSPLIFLDHIIECISVLRRGDLKSKVNLLLRFFDEDGNRTISSSEMAGYLKGADESFLKKIGFNKDNDEIKYEDLLHIFETADRGEEAMKLFCDQILRLLLDCVNISHQGKSPDNPSSLVRRFTRQFSRSSTSFEIPREPCIDFDVVRIWYEKIRNKLRSISHVNYYKFVLVLLQIMFWLINFFYYRSHGYPLSFCIAKGFGLNLRVFSIFIYASMARTTMGQLYAIPFLRPFIPLGINIEIHSFIGYSIAMHMFGHTFGHIAYQTMYTSGFQNAFTQNSLLRGNNWEEKLKGDGKTGFLLLAFVLVMGATALFRSFSSFNYSIFHIVHFFYLLYLPMLFLHVPHLWPYFLSIAAVMIFERFYDFYQKTYYTTLIQSRPCHNGVTFLSIPRHGKMTYPGSYYRIKIPSIAVNEWHPFSLAGNTNTHTLTFFIASSGDWTRKLYQIVKDPQKRQTTVVQVQGPFLAPASQALVRKAGGKILSVASGIGITPFFSVMATKVMNEVSYENDQMLYKALFQEVNNKYAKKFSANNKEPTSLLGILQETRKRKEAIKHLQEKDQQLKAQQHQYSRLNNVASEDVEYGEVIQIDGPQGTDTSFDLNRHAPIPFDQDENDSILKVVWSIRDWKELYFYLEYVHHLVKSQEILHEHDDYSLTTPTETNTNNNMDEKDGSPMLTSQQSKKKIRNAVEVEVYLTGLGNKTDPIYMLSQTFFLLSIATKTSSYMKIHFGRPDLKKIVEDFRPEEVYFCGGNILKEGLEVVCFENNIPFHPEDFDSGGGHVVKTISSWMNSFGSIISYPLSVFSSIAATTSPSVPPGSPKKEGSSSPNRPDGRPGSVTKKRGSLG